MYIGGLASGIDTEALIDQLLAIERRPMVQMQTRKDQLGLQRDAWRDINTRLNSLRERMGALRDTSLFHGRAASSTGPDIVSAVAAERAAEGRYELIVDQLAQAHRVKSSEHAKDATFQLAGTATLAGETIDFGDGDQFSLQDIANKINESDAAVRATVVDGNLVLRATEAGVDNKITFGDDSVWQTLGFVDGAGNIAEELTEARNAMVRVEGVTVERATNVIDDLFEGVTFTLHEEGSAEVTVSKDFDGIVDAVKSFVEQYNSVRNFMANASKSSEDPKQRGVLNGDSMVLRIQSQLRTGLMGGVSNEGSFTTLMAIGIEIDRYGTMTLDESKLRTALDEDADGVQRLFAADPEEDGFSGVAVRLETTFQTWLQQNTGLLAERQKMFGNQLRSIDESMDRMERRLEMRERTIMRQMVQLETVMGRFQEQAMWLQGQLQQLNGMIGR